MEPVAYKGNDPNRELADVQLVYSWAEIVRPFASFPEIERSDVEQVNGVAGQQLRSLFANKMFRDLDMSCLVDAIAIYDLYISGEEIDPTFMKATKERCERELIKKVGPHVSRLLEDQKVAPDFSNLSIGLLVHSYAVSMLEKIIDWHTNNRSDLYFLLQALHKLPPAQPTPTV